METNKILNADVLDIIFDGRNKQYGAYDLRKTYNRRLTKAMGVMFGVCLIAITSSVLAGNDKNKNIKPVLVSEVNLSSVVEKPVEPPPVTPPPVKKPPVIETIKSTPPKIVTEEVKTPPPTQAEQNDVHIGVVDLKGEKGDIVAPPVEVIGTGKVDVPVKELDYEHEFKTVQIQASFPEGADGWVKYLRRNLRNEVPIDNGAPAGNYPVVVSFLVDKEGNITEVKAETNPGYGTAEEAVRVIQRSGKWKPANQNGRAVIYRQRQQITFQVADNQ